jgi:hypothetical protein
LKISAGFKILPIRIQYSNLFLKNNCGISEIFLGTLIVARLWVKRFLIAFQ